jgi:hypothetical protein
MFGSHQTLQGTVNNSLKISMCILRDLPSKIAEGDPFFCNQKTHKEK